ncbi:hypothetical protein BDE40_0126 [Litoreibacter halocynthiae]|uniref:Uncharacterized protein n=1 Tax=Litoreibacter halocynthiae TaxID=1242689 RepID=A0A4R7LMH9_9RHOB|nr:hypothetical protein BDE40_0126 [Litoreibacter halocynthiae]
MLFDVIYYDYIRETSMPIDQEPQEFSFSDSFNKTVEEFEELEAAAQEDYNRTNHPLEESKET